MTSAAPGWYPGPDGRQTWWDGARWHDAPPPRPPDPALAVLPHLGMLVFPVVVPLVMRLTVGRDDRWQRHHATEALNAQIWFVIVWNAVGLTGVVLGAVLFVNSGGVDPDLFVTFWVLTVVQWPIFAGLGVWAAVRTHRGAWWRYPLPYRFVRGAVTARDRD